MTAAYAQKAESDLDFGIYIHWPFCASLCPYCDFNAHVRDDIDHDRWARAYARELTTIAGYTGSMRVDSIFFGGGTPSLMRPSTTSAVLESIYANFAVADNIEITMEANPTSVEADAFADFRAAGVNRLSLGIQALNDNDLAFLGRTHSRDQALNALEIANDHFPRVNFDLIYARPGQRPRDWEAELLRALALAQKGHLSLYQLTIERGTRFATRFKRGEFDIPDSDSGADFYDITQAACEAAGMPAYEISNHAVPGEESVHNMLYWRGGLYAGVGPGAHGRIQGRDGRIYATVAHRAPEVWLERVEREGHGYHPFNPLTPLERAQERLMTGLRMRDGVKLDRIAALLDEGIEALINMECVDNLAGAGFVEMDRSANRLMPTQAGMRCLNSVLGYIMR
jgi:oxygen-independent coproporphyrinogen-3 oxidase